MQNNIKWFESRNCLSPEELINYRNQNFSTTQSSGLKKTKSDGSKEEKDQLLKLQDDLKKQISFHRIERICKRSKAEWLSDEKKVLLLKKEGKFQQFGYSENSQIFLENHEALFLIELNRLELYYSSVLISLEQAYLLLLGEEQSRNYDKYLVYSTFSRSGYTIQSYKNLDYKFTTPSEIDCIWTVLRSSVDNTYVVPSHLRDDPNFLSIQKNIEKIKLQTINSSKSEICRNETSDINFNIKIIGKRKSNADNDEFGHSSKKFKKNPLNNSFLTILMNQPEYKHFESLFNKINLIELNSNQNIEFNNSTKNNLEIDFDLYLPVNDDGEKYFRKSNPKPPYLRMIVIGYKDNFPNHHVISRCYNKQKFKIPLIVASVNESKQCQGFLYYFS